MVGSQDHKIAARVTPKVARSRDRRSDRAPTHHAKRFEVDLSSDSRSRAMDSSASACNRLHDMFCYVPSFSLLLIMPSPSVLRPLSLFPQKKSNRGERRGERQISRLVKEEKQRSHCRKRSSGRPVFGSALSHDCEAAPYPCLAVAEV
jgi:hypothetical protein